MGTEIKLDNGESRQLVVRVLRLNSWVLGLVLGLLSGICLFVATIWLVIKGGDPVGPHLALLGQYFIGYRVTFAGGLVGFAYAFVVGGLGGVLIGWIYNRVVDLRRSPSHD